MATWHRANDPPLNSPIEDLAASVSGSVLVVKRTQATAVMAGDLPPAVAAVMAPKAADVIGDGCGGGGGEQVQMQELAAALVKALGDDAGVS